MYFLCVCPSLAQRRRFSPAVRHTVLATLLVPLGCGSGDAPRTTFATRDSAGIRIVVSLAPAWTEGDAWSVDSIPNLDLSGGDDEELFRIGSGRLLEDGRLVFFNGGACEVRSYSSSGALLARVGRCGEGPGEFEDFATLWVWHDSIVVIDQLTRVTVLGTDGTLRRTARLPASRDLPVPFVRGVLDDGTFVVAGLRDPVGRTSPGVEPGQSTLGLLRSLDDTTRIVGTYPGPTFEYTEFGGRLGRGPLAFSSSTQFAAGGNHVFVGFPDRYEIRIHGADGSLQGIIRRAFTPVRVDQHDLDWLMERRLAEVDGEENQRAVRQAFRNLRHAELMPAFGPPVWPGGAEGGPAMLVDAEGNLWVFVHYRPGEYRNDWSVFSADGVWLGTVALPEHLAPSQMGADHIIGSWTDETGFVHIRRHRLIKP